MAFIDLAEGSSASVLDQPQENSGLRHIRLKISSSEAEFLEKNGRIPLPPYIDREDSDMDRDLYQR